MNWKGKVQKRDQLEGSCSNLSEGHLDWYGNRGDTVNEELLDIVGVELTGFSDNLFWRLREEGIKGPFTEMKKDQKFSLGHGQYEGSSR